MDRIRNYEQGVAEIETLTSIRSNLEVPATEYTPDESQPARDRVFTFAQEEEILSILGDIDTGVKNFVDKTNTNTEDIATNAVNIAQNKGSISANDKRISNIEKLLQGNLYDYQTDSTEAYTKTVPSGAMPYAGLEQIGGKTLVMNQVCSTTIATNTTGLTVTRNDDGSYTLNGTSVAGWLNFTITNVYVGHKYIVFGCPSGYSAYMGIGVTNIDSGSGGIWTSTATSASTLRLHTSADVVFDNVKLYTNVIDMTLMFGAGNEPTTIEQFREMFPAEYYPYNAGELLSAEVTEVTSKGKNLADYSGGLGVPSNTGNSTATKRIFEVGKYIKGISYNNAYYGSHVSVSAISADVISFTSANSIYGVGIPFNCKPSTTYSVSVGTITNGNTVLSWYGEDGSFLSYNLVTASNPSVSSPANAKQGVLCLYSATTNRTSTFQNIQVEENSVVTPYSPAGVIATYPIPAEIQALEGYGWSAGTVYNYVDFERKVFVQNVGSRAYESGDESDATVTTDMTTTYYPLATPVETDISAYLSDDNLIEVEAGGTLTFENQHGDDYRIPVPSEETYMINLQEAVSNG